MNSYMDFEDYESPVKIYMDDRFSYRGVPGFKKQVKMYMKENTVEMSDSLLGIGQPTEQKFFSIENAVHDIFTFAEQDIFEVNFLLDAQKDAYTRTVFSFLDLFGKLGGVFEIMCISMGLLVGLFSKNVLLFSMFKRLYHTEREGIQIENYEDDQVKANNNGETIPKTQSNLFSSSWNEEQKVIPVQKRSNLIIGQNHVMKRIRRNLFTDSPEESCAFDEVEQTSGVGMNLQDNHANNDDSQNQLEKDEHIRDLK